LGFTCLLYTAVAFSLLEKGSSPPISKGSALKGSKKSKISVSIGAVNL